MDQRAENKLFLRIFVVACALVAVLVLVYWLFGETLIRTYYEGKGFGLVPSDGNPDKGVFEAYRARVGWRFWHNLVMGIPLSLIALLGLFRLYRYLFHQTQHQTMPPASERGPAYFVPAAAVVYGLFTLGIFYPSLRHAHNALIGPPGDTMACLWTLEYGSRHLFDGGLSYVTSLFYPEGSSFYYHAWSFYNLSVYSLLRSAFDAAISYNALVLMTFPLSGLSAFLLFRYLTGNRWLALLGGFLFAFNPSHMERAQHHLNIATIQFLPLFVLFYIRSIRERSWLWPLLAAGALILNATADWNYLVFCLSFMVFSYVYLMVRRRRLWLWDVAWKSSVVAGAAVVVLSPLLLPMVRLGLEAGGAQAGGHNQFVVDMLELVIPNPLHAFGDWSPVQFVNGLYTGVICESTGYLGLAALGLIIVTWRDTLRSAAKYVLGWLSFLLMSFGSQPHLAGINIPVLTPGRLLPMIPLISNSRAPGRFIVLAYLFWSLVTVIALGGLWSRMSRTILRNSVVGGIVILLVLDYTAISHDTTPIQVPACYATLPRNGEPYGVLDLPSGYVPVERYMMYQELHRIPIVQGWVSRKLEPTLIDTLDYSDLNHQREQLVGANVRFVILHKQYLPNDSVDLENYLRVYRVTYEDTSNIVLQVY